MLGEKKLNPGHLSFHITALRNKSFCLAGKCWQSSEQWHSSNQLSFPAQRGWYLTPWRWLSGADYAGQRAHVFAFLNKCFNHLRNANDILSLSLPWILQSLSTEIGAVRVFWGSPKVWLPPHLWGPGEFTVVASESLGPGTGSNFLDLGNFGSISASVQQKTCRLGRNTQRCARGTHSAQAPEDRVLRLSFKFYKRYVCCCCWGFFPLCRDIEWHRKCLGRALLGLWNLVKWEDRGEPSLPLWFLHGFAGAWVREAALCTSEHSAFALQLLRQNS